MLKLLQINDTPRDNRDKENENAFGNSIIKLEEQLNNQTFVQKQRPTGSKINELKRKIERM